LVSVQTFSTDNVCTDTNHSATQAPHYTENVCTDTNHSAIQAPHYTENVCTDTNHSGIQAPHYTENVCTDTNLHRKCLYMYRHQPLRHPGPTLHRKCLYGHQPLSDPCPTLHRKCLYRHQLTQKMFVQVQTPTTQARLYKHFLCNVGPGWLSGWCLYKHFLCNGGPGCLSGWCLYLYKHFVCKLVSVQTFSV
jgi:hypothetical protein